MPTLKKTQPQRNTFFQRQFHKLPPEWQVTLEELLPRGKVAVVAVFAAVVMILSFMWQLWHNLSEL
jgi:hypothetical protein